MLDAKTQSLVGLLKAWKVEDDDHEFLFTADEWQLRDAEIAFPQLVIDRSFHFFSLIEDDLPVEVTQRRPVANWFAEPDGYIALGIQLIAFVLSDIPCLTLSLSHRESRISTLYFHKQPPMRVPTFLTHAPVRFTSYRYIPESIGRHSFFCADAAQSERTDNTLLATGFSWSDQAQNFEQTATPDSLVIAATPQRLVELGELLIDFGRDETEADEIAMESALDGAGGVAHGSVEQKFWRPGSLGFPETSLDTLSLPPA